MSDPVSKIRVVPLADLRPDPLNANKGSERGTEALEESLQEDGAGRGILLDAEGTIIAGNKTAQKARELGFERVLVVPTDGKTLVATQRIDVPAGSLQAKRMGVRDNRVAEVSMTWDAAVLDALGKDGVDLASMWTESELEALLAGGEQEGADVEPIESGSGESSTDALDYLVIGKYRIPLDAEEASGLLGMVESYIEESGTTFGFGGHLLRATGVRT